MIAFDLTHGIAESGITTAIGAADFLHGIKNAGVVLLRHKIHIREPTLAKKAYYFIFCAIDRDLWAQNVWTARETLGYRVENKIHDVGCFHRVIMGHKAHSSLQEIS